MIRRIITYMLSSGITVLVDFGIFTAATQLFGASVALATALGRAFAAIVNFTINRNAVFKSDGKVYVQFLKYISLVIVSGTISAFCVDNLSDLFAGNLTVTKAVVETVLFVFNYLVQRILIFRAPKKLPAESEQGS